MPAPKKAAKKVTESVVEKPAETREQKLARLAAYRMKAALKRISLVGNLAAYKPTDPQIDKICEALASACQMLEARLRGTKRDVGDFTL